MRTPTQLALDHLTQAEQSLHTQAEPTPEFHHAAVIGAGTMGLGIAMVIADAGIPVLLLDTTQPALDHALTLIRTLYTHQQAKGKLTPQQVEDRLARITPTLTYAGFEQADFIIEAAFEALPLKHEIFATLDRIAKPTAILATNTSSLSIDEIARATTRPASVVGTHFFTPPTSARLLEIVRGTHTSPETLATAQAFGRLIGKLPVVVGNCKGFVANRLFLPLHRQAQFLVEEGASPYQVDRALQSFGFPLGPFMILDLVGLDTGHRIHHAHLHLETPGTRLPYIEQRLHDAGRLGRKTHLGWYRYDDRMRPTEDPTLSTFLPPPSPITDEKIIDRCILVLINESARILEDRIVPRAALIDLIFVAAYAFPPTLGGPTFYADTLGLPAVLTRLRTLASLHGDPYRPAPLLEHLAATNSTFAQYDQTQP